MIRRGDLVYDKADPRHVGRVDHIWHAREGTFVAVTWLATGHRSFRLPARDMRQAPEDFQ